METESNTVANAIPVFYMNTVDKEIKKLNRKCVRYGIPEIKVEKSAPRINTHTYRETPLGKEITITTEVIDCVFTFYDIIIEGGWNVIATIEPSEIEGMTIINGKIDEVGDLKEYDLRWCDHCQKNRKRNKVIVIDDKDGNRKVIGSTCVKDYLGIDASAIMFACSLNDYLFRIMHPKPIGDDIDADEWGFGGSFAGPSYTAEDVAIAVCHIMRGHKWTYIKRDRNACEYDDSCCTIDDVKILLNLLYTPGFGGKLSDVAKALLEDYDENYESNKSIVAELMTELKEEYSIESLKEGEHGDSFNYSFGICVNSTFIPEKSENLFMGMLGFRLSKKMQPKTVKHNPEDSEYVYDIKEKVKGINVKIKSTRVVGSFYGDSLMVTGWIEDTDNQFVSFINGKTDFLLDDSGKYVEEVKVAFTVKDHQDRGYGKQTVLTRLRASK